MKHLLLLLFIVGVAGTSLTGCAIRPYPIGGTVIIAPPGNQHYGHHNRHHDDDDDD